MKKSYYIIVLASLLLAISSCERRSRRKQSARIEQTQKEATIQKEAPKETADQKPKRKKKQAQAHPKASECDYYINVVGIVDGDTFDGLTQDNVEIRYRIYGVDAPELKQAYSQKSKQYFADLIFGKNVGIKVQKKRDGYGRPVIWIFTPDGKDVGAEMLKAGMAWHATKYDQSKEYAELQEYAKKNKIGLWQDKNPIEPWNYRREKKKKEVTGS